jgi:hypothetical protein
MDPKHNKDCLSGLCKKEQLNLKHELTNIQPVVKKTNDGLLPVDIAGLKGNIAVIKEFILYAQEQIEEQLLYSSRNASGMVQNERFDQLFEEFEENK